MVLVAELFFEDAGNKTVRSIWQSFAENNISTSMLDKPFHPHISLGIIPYELKSHSIGALKSFTAQHSCIPINMPHFGIFTSPSCVIFLGVTVTNALFQLHRNFYQDGSDYVNSETLYAPNFWIPHCTLAYNLDAEKLPSAITVCQRHSMPISTYTNGIALVETDSGEVFAEHPFVSS